MLSKYFHSNTDDANFNYETKIILNKWKVHYKVPLKYQIATN